MRPGAVLLAACLSMAVGCAVASVRAPVVPPTGILFTSAKAPLQVDFDDTKLGSKHGTAKTSYFWDPILTGMSFAWDSAAIEKAAREAGIQTVHHVDYELFSVLGVYATFTVHVYGD